MRKVSWAVLHLGVALLGLWGLADVVVLILGSLFLASERNYTKGDQGPAIWTFLHF